jgi:hypothetical protein
LFKVADANNRDVVALEIMEIVRQVAADFPRKRRNPL